MRDDRGQCVRIADDAKAQLRPITSDLNRRARRYYPLFLRIWLYAVYAAVGVLLLLFVYGVVTPGPPSDVFGSPLNWMGRLAAGSFILICVSCLLLPLFRGRAKPWHARAARDMCVCAGCMYDLRSVPRSDDGCTVCPECGAAWKLLSRDG